MSGHRPRRSTTERGLGWEHQKRRRAMVAAAIGTLCPLRISPRCTGLMTDTRLMDLDHSIPRAMGGTTGDRVVCRYCNRTAGARLGNQMRSYRVSAPKPGPRHSREW